MNLIFYFNNFPEIVSIENTINSRTEMPDAPIIKPKNPPISASIWLKGYSSFSSIVVNVSGFSYLILIVYRKNFVALLVESNGKHLFLPKELIISTLPE